MNTFHTDCQWFKNTLANNELIAQLKEIKLIVFDVDGTLTDAGIHVDLAGEGGRTFSVQDGYAFRPAMTAGFTLVLMSGKDNPTTLLRGAKLGVPPELCFAGMEAKPAAIRKLQAERGFTPTQTLIIGDDHFDAIVKQEGVALFACPADAPFYYQCYADLVLPRPGGNQAARLVLDLLLYIHNKHFSQALITKALGTCAI
jgi:3-deoxy-D-manno-octulosonate 8-phosphate phosphatase (KDO 8-P phosphatase)